MIIPTQAAKHLKDVMHVTMNFGLDELKQAGVVETTGQWSKWNSDAPMVIVKSSPEKLNALAALIDASFPDVLAPVNSHASLTECVKVLREALDALFIQALQSDVNDASNDYGIEAIAKADAALSRAKELVP